MENKEETTTEYTLEFTGTLLDMLRATLVCMGKKDVRYYLNGIHINRDHIVATDGSRLAMFNTPVPNGGIQDDVKPAIVPPFKVPGSIGKVRINVEGERVTIEKYNKKLAMVSTEVYQAIDGRYPDYKRVVPESGSKYSSHFIDFDPSLIADIQKVVKGEQIIRLENNGEDAGMFALFGTMPDLTVVIMPGRFGV